MIDKSKVYLYPWRYDKDLNEWSRDRFGFGAKWCSVWKDGEGFWRNAMDGVPYITREEAMFGRDKFFYTGSLFDGDRGTVVLIPEDEVERYQMLEVLL